MFCFDCDTHLWMFLKTGLKMSDNANTKKKKKYMENSWLFCYLYLDYTCTQYCALSLNFT